MSYPIRYDAICYDAIDYDAVGNDAIGYDAIGYDARGYAIGYAIGYGTTLGCSDSPILRTSLIPLCGPSLPLDGLPNPLAALRNFIP